MCCCNRRRETLHPEQIVFQTFIITRCNSVKICKPTKNNHQCKLQDMIFVRVNSAEWAPIIRLSLVEEIFNIFIHLSSSLGASLGLLTTWQKSVLWQKWGKQSARKFVAFAVGKRHWPGLWGRGGVSMIVTSSPNFHSCQPLLFYFSAFGGGIHIKPFTQASMKKGIKTWFEFCKSISSAWIQFSFIGLIRERLW